MKNNFYDEQKRKMERLKRELAEEAAKDLTHESKEV